VLLPPDSSTEEVAIYAEAIAHDELIASLRDGEALRLLRRIEEEDIPIGKILPLVLRGARLATLSLSPPAPPS
jgi:hypothetical protein